MGFQFRYALVQLQNDFPDHTSSWLRDQLELHSHHYTPTLRAVQSQIARENGLIYRAGTYFYDFLFGRGNMKDQALKFARDPDRFRQETLAADLPFPDTIEESFYKELMYVKNFDTVERKFIFLLRPFLPIFVFMDNTYPENHDL